MGAGHLKWREVVSGSDARELDEEDELEEHQQGGTEASIDKATTVDRFAVTSKFASAYPSVSMVTR